jgi:hypothetical protein
MISGALVLLKSGEGAESVQVRAVWDGLMEVAPNPEAACVADPAVLEAIIRPLGFHRFRARAIGSMSHDYLNVSWSRPSQLRHVGKYASDAYFIFCRCVQHLCSVLVAEQSSKSKLLRQVLYISVYVACTNCKP